MHLRPPSLQKKTGLESVHLDTNYYPKPNGYSPNITKLSTQNNLQNGYEEPAYF